MAHQGPRDGIGTPASEIAEAFYDYYSDELGAINAIKNILLAQEFLKAREIPYLFSWIGGGVPGAQRIGSPIVGRLLELIDRAPLCPTSIEQADVFVDRAADHAHPGPQSHARFAARMLATCQAVYPLEHFRPAAIAARAAQRPGAHRIALPSRADHNVVARSLPPPEPRDDAGRDQAALRSRQSRWQRLRDKIRRLKKEDPNIYPLY